MQGANGTPITGNNNTCWGAKCYTLLRGTANNNSALGFSAFQTATTAQFTTGLGYNVGATCTTCQHVLVLGDGTDVSGAAVANEIDIGANGGAVNWVRVTGTSAPATASTTMHSSTIAFPDVPSVTTATTGTVCWTATALSYDPTNTCLVSAARFKRDVTPLAGATAELGAMRPVSFQYKTDPADVHFGMIAERKWRGSILVWSSMIEPDSRFRSSIWT